jgi:hypothetical protein
LWWDKLSEEQRNQVGSVAFYKCPTRRSGVQLTTDHDPYTSANTNGVAVGPCADYAVVIFVRQRDGTIPVVTNTGTNLWYCHGSPFNNAISTLNNYHEVHRGPIRWAVPTGPLPTTTTATDEAAIRACVNALVPRDGIAWWSDGTSNQIVVGEKHVPQNRLRQCLAANFWTQGDCSFLASAAGSQSIGRQIHSALFLAKFPTDYSRDDNADSTLFGYGFGSYHPGTCHFLIGDGAVKTFSNSTPMETILCPLAEVNDGVSVSLP